VVALGLGQQGQASHEAEGAAEAADPVSFVDGL
jgi:hypothetical protein